MYSWVLLFINSWQVNGLALRIYSKSIIGRDRLQKFYRGVSLIVLSAIGFGIMPIFALIAYRSKINVMTLLFIRFLISAAIFLGYLSIRRWIRGEKVKLTLKQLGALFGMGGVFYTLQSTLYFSALRFISPSLTALLFYTYPIIVAVVSFFVTHVKLTKRHFSAMIMTTLGLLLVLGMPTAKISPIGILLALGAALVYSGYIVLGDHLVQNVPSIVSSAYVTLFAALSFSVIGLSTQNLHFDFKMNAWLPMLGIILFSTLMAILTFFKGLELTGPTTASILSTLEPVVTISLSFIFIHEKLSFYQFLGGAAVLSGAILIVLSKRFSPGNPDPVTKGISHE
jgi:Predicted permease, DMT superfamily